MQSDRQPPEAVHIHGPEQFGKRLRAAARPGDQECIQSGFTHQARPALGERPEELRRRFGREVLERNDLDPDSGARIKAHGEIHRPIGRNHLIAARDGNQCRPVHQQHLLHQRKHLITWNLSLRLQCDRSLDTAVHRVVQTEDAAEHRPCELTHIGVRKVELDAIGRAVPHRRRLASRPYPQAAALDVGFALDPVAKGGWFRRWAAASWPDLTFGRLSDQ